MKKTICLLLLVLIYACVFYSQDIVSKPEIIQSHDFIMEYKNHEIRADSKYFGNKVLIRGLCDEFGILIDPRIEEFRNQGYSYVPSIRIYFERGNFYKGAVMFFFSDDQKKQIAALDIGTQVTIEGTVYKCNGPYIYIVDCKIIEE